ncbi:MAG: hypothetical protein GVY23_06615 [Spirochaetes bacterium]|jgi:hypothetical protein|nr:hypothetical protein [Spirochaetota bacterium]
MKRICTVVCVIIALTTPVFAGGGHEPREHTVPVNDGVPASILVTAGEHFTHKLRVMPLIRVSNAPQMVAWCETPAGEFLTTLFVTDRIATQSWRGAPADPKRTESIRRPESLPVWSHRRGEVYADGLPVPTRENPMPDAVTTATPKADFEMATLLPGGHERLVVYFEVNHSADFNEFFTADAPETEENYSGGEWGSGQPALVYVAQIDVTDIRDGEPVALEPVGHSSPDGSTGAIAGDLGTITTAEDIVDSVHLMVGTGD